MIFSIYFLFLFSSLIAIFSEYFSLNNNRILFFFIFIVMVIIAIFRDGSIMPDYKMYNNLFKLVIQEKNYYPIEISFVFLSKISNLISRYNFFILLFFYAILSLSLKFYLIHKLSPHIFFSILLLICNYYIIQDLVQIRSSVSTSFIYLGVYFLLNKKDYTFFFLIILASLFHISALFFLFFYFLRKNDFSIKNFIILLFFAYLFSFYLYKLLNFSINFIPINYIQYKLSGYSSFTRINLFKINIFGIFIISKILLFFILLNFQKRINSYSYNILLKIYGYGIIIYITLSSIPELAVRLSHVCFFSEIILIPYLINMYKQRIIPCFTIILFSFFLLFYNISFSSLFGN